MADNYQKFDLLGNQNEGAYNRLAGNPSAFAEAWRGYQKPTIGPQLLSPVSKSGPSGKGPIKPPSDPQFWNTTPQWSEDRFKTSTGQRMSDFVPLFSSGMENFVTKTLGEDPNSRFNIASPTTAHLMFEAMSPEEKRGALVNALQKKGINAGNFNDLTALSKADFDRKNIQKEATMGLAGALTSPSAIDMIRHPDNPNADRYELPANPKGSWPGPDITRKAREGIGLPGSIPADPRAYDAMWETGKNTIVGAVGKAANINQMRKLFGLGVTNIYGPEMGQALADPGKNLPGSDSAEAVSQFLKLSQPYP